MSAGGPDLVVHAPDLPGFGGSERPACILTVAELADVVAGYMDAEAIPRAALVSNSFGCEIAIEMGLRHPHRIDRLVLQGATLDPKDRSALDQIAGLLADARPVPVCIGAGLPFALLRERACAITAHSPSLCASKCSRASSAVL